MVTWAGALGRRLPRLLGTVLLLVCTLGLFRVIPDHALLTCDTVREHILVAYGGTTEDRRMTQYPHISAPGLPRVVSRAEKEIFHKMLKLLVTQLDAYNVSYVMAGATLAGSYMMHDMLPWDDDIDLWVDLKHLPRVKRMFRQKGVWDGHTVLAFWAIYNEYSMENLDSFPENVPDHEYYNLRYKVPPPPDYSDNMWAGPIGNYHMFKLYRNDGETICKNNLVWNNCKEWLWPFIDVFYYTENRTHVWNYEFTKRGIHYIEKDHFYPFVKRPFGDLWLNAPFDSRGHLQKRYKHFRCHLAKYSHRTDQRQDRSKACCAALLHYYPFVWPAPATQEGVQNEQLRFADSVVHVKQIEGSGPDQSKRPFDF